MAGSLAVASNHHNLNAKDSQLEKSDAKSIEDTPGPEETEDGSDLRNLEDKDEGPKSENGEISEDFRTLDDAQSSDEVQNLDNSKTSNEDQTSNETSTSDVTLASGETTATPNDTKGSNDSSKSTKQDLIGMTGVSTDLSVTYLRPGGIVGNTIFIEAECDRIGRRMAFTRVTFYEQGEKIKKGRIVARGSHTKFLPESAE